MGLTRTRFIQANTALAKIQDPILVLNSDSSIANVDVGFLINRNQGAKSNVALYWNESGSEFVTALTSNTGITNSNITITSYANIRAGVIFANIGGASDSTNIYTTGNIIPSANTSYDLGSSNRRYKTLWLGGNTIVVGNETLSVNEAGEWVFTSGANTATIGNLYNFTGDNATTGNLTVTGNLNVLGSTFILSSTNTSLVDSILDLHTQANLAPLTGDDGRDIGLKFHYFKTEDEHAFLGWSNDSGYLEWYDSGREGVGNVFTGNTYGTIKTGQAWLVNTTPSTSTTTGALRVNGGVGIAGNLYIANTGDVSANIGTIKNNLSTIDANVGSYQTYANANAAGQQDSITSLTSNAATQQISIDNLNSNIGSFQTYANANIGTITNEISSIVSGANANTAAYLLTATGNISAGNITTSANIYGSIVPSTIFKSVYIGTTPVDLSRTSGSLTVDNFNTTGYAEQANLSVLATNATKTTVTSNISSGTAYVTFVSATTGNVNQHVNNALTYDPNSGNLQSYAGFVVTDLTTGGNLYITDGIRWTGNGDAFVTSLYSNSNVASYLPVDSTILSIQANLGAYQNYANANIGAITLDISSLQSNAAIQANLIDVLTGNAATQGSLLDTLVSNAASQADSLTLLVSNAASQADSLTNLLSNAAAQEESLTAIVGNASAYQIWANTSITSLYTNANANTAAYLTTYTGNIQSGNIDVTGNVNVASNVFANVFYTVNGIRWAGNGAVFQSGGGGGGGAGLPIDFGLITEIPAPTGLVDFGTLV